MINQQADGTIVSERIGDYDRRIMVEAFYEEDELISILKISLEVELQLSRTLEEITEINCEDFEFHSKILMARVLRMPEEAWRMADFFRRLRNKFAHKKGTTLKENAKLVEALLNQPLPEVRSLKGWKITIVRGETGDERDFKFDKLTDLQKVVVTAMMLVQFFRLVPEHFSFPPPVQLVKLGKVRNQ